MLDPEDQGPEVLDTLICDNALLVLADGVENVEAAIADTVMEWDAKPEPDRAEIDEAFVRGVLHANTPGQTIARIAEKEMHIAGQICTAGMPIFLSLASANARSSDGIDYSFGMGRHRCLGEGLAIETIAACSRALVQRSPVIDAGNHAFEQVFGHRWTRGVLVRLSV
jgi:cytochrome P450